MILALFFTDFVEVVHYIYVSIKSLYNIVAMTILGPYYEN